MDEDLVISLTLFEKVEKALVLLPYISLDWGYDQESCCKYFLTTLGFLNRYCSFGVYDSTSPITKSPKKKPSLKIIR